MKSQEYDAFISYPHAGDARLAAILQSGLQCFAKPWYRLRALRVFLDKTNLSANPALWTTIENALDDTRFFILLASPESACSDGVRKELKHWLETRSLDNLLIILTDGEIHWDNTVGDFDPEATTALPEELRGVFQEEPLYVDLRWARREPDLRRRDNRLREAFADLAAPLHGRPKDELAGEDLQQHRRSLRLAWGASTLLLLLAILAGFALHRALVKEIEADRKGRGTDIARLIDKAQLVAQSAPVKATLLAVEAIRTSERAGEKPLPEAFAALQRLLQERIIGTSVGSLGGDLSTVTISPDGRWVAAGSNNGTLALWDGMHDNRNPTLNVKQPARVSALTFSPMSRWLLSGSDYGDVKAWDLTGAVADNEPHSLGSLQGSVTKLTTASNNRYLAAASWGGSLSAWYIDELDAPHFAVKDLPNFVEEKFLRVAFPNDRGRDLVAVTQDGAVYRITILQGGEHKFAPVRGKINDPIGGSYPISVSPDGFWLVWRSQSLAALIHRSSDLTDAAAILDGRTQDAVFSADARYVLLASNDPVSMQLISLSESGESKMLLNSSKIGAPMAFSFDSKRFVVTAPDHSIHLYSISDLNQPIAILHGHDRDVRTLSFSQDGEWLVSADTGGSVHRWPLRNASSPREPFSLATRMQAAEMAPASLFESIERWERQRRFYFTKGDAELLVLSGGFMSESPALRRVSLETYVTMDEIPADPRDATYCLARTVTHNGRWIAAIFSDGEHEEIHLWELGKRLEAWRLPLPPESQSWNAELIVSEDGRWLGYRYPFGDGRLRLFDTHLEDREAVAVIEAPERSQYRFTRDNRWLIQAASDVSLTLRDLQADGFPTRKLECRRVGGRITMYTNSADGRWLAVGGDSEAALLWDLHAPEGTPPHELQLLQDRTGSPVRLTLSADGSFLAATTGGDAVTLFRITASGPSEQSTLLRGHDGAVTALAIDNTGRRLVTADETKTVRLWDFGQENREPEPILLNYGGNFLLRLAFSPSGEWLVGQNYDDDLTIWQVGLDGLLQRARAFAGRNLTRSEWEEIHPGEPFLKTFPTLPMPESDTINH